MLARSAAAPGLTRSRAIVPYMAILLCRATRRAARHRGNAGWKLQHLEDGEHRTRGGFGDVTTLGGVDHEDDRSAVHDELTAVTSGDEICAGAEARHILRTGRRSAHR